MTGIWMVVGLGAIVALAWGLTVWLRHYAATHQLIDVPNARSSHQVPTPRGGGVAIVVAASVGLTWLVWSGDPTALPWEVIVAGLGVAVVGFVDDHRSLSARVRLGAHFAAAIVAVVILERLAPWPFWESGALRVVRDAAAVVFVVWQLNLTNFMDGIDGIASGQVVTVCATGAALAAWTVPGGAFWVAPAVIGAAASGFLVLNWPPARIFMGDAGSGYLGFMIGVLTLRAWQLAPELGLTWVIMSAVFVVDATVTLLHRAVRGATLFEAHRDHAYQHLAIAWQSHRRVTSLVLAINGLWLAPLAVLASAHVLSPAVAVGLAYGPLAVVVFLAGAGVSSLEPQGRAPARPRAK